MSPSSRNAASMAFHFGPGHLAARIEEIPELQKVVGLGDILRLLPRGLPHEGNGRLAVPQVQKPRHALIVNHDQRLEPGPMRHGPAPIGHRAGERQLGRVVDRKARSRNPTDSAKKLNGGSRMVVSIAPAKSAEKPASEKLTDRGRAGDVVTGQMLTPMFTP
jgi:hypothetical protein